ncbi:MAG: hypothetical protein R3190_10990, partial [Thermoanaerobaculia bacterium]|nr:hypothetical protein [Thermoanaerobaculia bacterium]
MFCRQCNTRMGPGDRYCPNCGKAASAGSSLAEAAPLLPPDADEATETQQAEAVAETLPDDEEVFEDEEMLDEEIEVDVEEDEDAPEEDTPIAASPEETQVTDPPPTKPEVETSKNDE